MMIILLMIWFVDVVGETAKEEVFPESRALVGPSHAVTVRVDPAVAAATVMTAFSQ